MLQSARIPGIDRRNLLAGGLFAAVVPFAAPAKAAGVSSWIAYEARLRARMSDAGGGAFEADFAHDLLAQVNGFRRGQRLSSLRWDEGLAACARAHAADMAGIVAPRLICAQPFRHRDSGPPQPRIAIAGHLGIGNA